MALVEGVAGLGREPTVADLIGSLEPEISDCLGAGPTAALRARGRSLALGLFRGIGLELPLAARAAPADLLLKLAPAAALRPLTASLHESGSLARLLAALSDPAHERFGQLADAWLEYDVGSGDARRASLFAGPASPALAAPVAALLGATPPARADLRRLVRALDADDWVQQVGVMHGRERPELRCLLTSRAATGGPSVAALERVGWQGDETAVRAILSSYRPVVDWWALGVGVDSEGGLLAPVGLELYARDQDGTQRILTRLERDGLAAAGTSSRLLAWCGNRLGSRSDGVPVALRALSQLTGGRIVPAVIRLVHHVKLTVVPGAAPVAKAYIGARITLIG